MGGGHFWQNTGLRERGGLYNFGKLVTLCYFAVAKTSCQVQAVQCIFYKTITTPLINPSGQVPNWTSTGKGSFGKGIPPLKDTQKT